MHTTAIKCLNELVPSATFAGLILVVGLSVFAADHIPVTTPERPMDQYVEAPELTALVRAGKLPPVRERLPQIPPIVVPYEKVGRYGGTLRHLEMQYNQFSTVTRYMHEGLMDKTAPSGEASYPNLVQKLEVGDDLKTFTLTLRKGVKWSDGHELTTEDVLFGFDDILLFSESPDISRQDVAPSSLIIGGKVVEVQAVDDYTLVVRTNVPYVMYDKIMAGNWLNPMPSHYLKQFHPKYSESDQEPAQMMQEMRDTHADFTNLKRPSLGPWIVDTVKEGDFMLMKRNPYYWKVDPEGKQLPYADKLKIKMMKDQEVAVLNAIAGEFDWIAMSLTYNPVLFQNQRRGNYRIILTSPRYVGIKLMQAWISRAHEDIGDQKLAMLLRNETFLKALQWGIDNQQMVTALAQPALVDFIGIRLGHPRLSKGKPIGEDPRSAGMWEFLTQWQRFDTTGANSLLDELGLKIGPDGYRHYPDGGRVELTVGTYDTEGELVQMQAAIWERDLRIKVYTQHRPWSAMVQPWWRQGEIPMLQFSAGWWFWGTDDLSLGSFYQYPLTDWVMSGGKKGVEPHPGIRDAYMRIHELAQIYTRTPDQGDRFSLALEATELALKHHIVYPLTFCGKWDALYVNNRIKNIPGAYSGLRRTVRMEQWFIDE